MIIIGINGYIGSGKTTFSNYLFADKKRFVVHLDSIFDDLKQTYFKKNTIELLKSNGEKAFYIKKNCIPKNIYDRRLIKRVFINLKSVYANRYIRNIIERCKKDGISFLILEGSSLNLYSLDRLCDFKIFINSHSNVRFKRVLSRDKDGLEKLNILDEFHNGSSYFIDISDYLIVDNDGSEEELKEKIKAAEAQINEGIRLKSSVKASIHFKF